MCVFYLNCVMCMFQVNQSDWDGGLYSLVRKLQSMNVEKLHVCSLPVLPGKLSDKIEYFNQKVTDLLSIGMYNVC